MSYTMVSNGILDMGFDPYTQAVFMAIKSHFPVMRPGIRRIAAKAGCSHVTVIRRLALLARAGVLSIKKGRRGQWSEYSINEDYLTPNEAKAQKQGGWAGITRVAQFFARPKKVVNGGNGNAYKVVNGADHNKIPDKQDAAEGGFIGFAAMRERDPAIWDWRKGLPPAGFSLS